MSLPADYRWNEDPMAVPEFQSSVDEIFAEQLTEIGFKHPRPLLWVRDKTPEIRDMFALGKVFRGSLAPAWGFCCTFIPHVRGSTVSWHRTPKSARFNLFYDPWDYSRDTASWLASHDLNRRDVLPWSRDLAARSLAEAVPYWDGVRSLADLRSQYESSIESEPIRFGFRNYPDQQLSYAFVLAKLGARDEAETWFQEFRSSMGPSPDGLEKVRRLFDDLLAQTRLCR